METNGNLIEEGNTQNEIKIENVYNQLLPEGYVLGNSTTSHEYLSSSG